MRFEMSRNNGPKLLNDEALATHMHIVFVFILLCEDPFKYANLCKDICFFVHLLHIGLLYHSAYEQKVLDGIAQHCFPALGTQRPAPNAQRPASITQTQFGTRNRLQTELKPKPFIIIR